MDLISSRYRKPKGRPTKRRKMLAENSKKRWQKSSKTVDEKNSNRYSTKMELLCESCHESHGSVFSSFQEEAKNSHDINSKLVSAFLSIGRGYAALETFHLCSTCQQWTEKHLPNACTTYP
ncbi:uncharacterized protein TNCV_3884441 [Trichonephila clavipes]|nr:uncharacterized protein TNCV_3884441 [Trichonephila clavipes]